MGKKGFLFFIMTVFYVVLFFSCSNNEVSLHDGEIDTLRKTVSQMDGKIYWTQELDASILANKVYGADGISKSMEAYPNNVFASGVENTYEPVHPGIDGFALLNTSALEESARSNLKGFCNSVIEKKSADSYMDVNSMYALVVFNYDINRENKKFASYILGEPFVSESLVQCPVRFIEKNGTYQDVLVYLNPKNSYKIRALEFVIKEVEDEPN